jgi:beta-lactamase class A
MPTKQTKENDALPKTIAGREITEGVRDILNDFVNGDAGRSVSFRTHSDVAAECSINGDTIRPAASVMKLPMIMAVFKKATLGKINLDERVPASTFSKTRYVSVLAAFDSKTALSIREISRLAIITSDNPLAVFLNSIIPFDEVNALLFDICGDNQIVMKASFTEDELGSKNRVNTLTCISSLKLLSELRQNPIYEDILLAMRNNLRGNRIPAQLPESALVAHKTGSLAGVVNDIGFVEHGNVRFSVAFLTDNQADTLQTTNDISACTLSIHDYLKSKC